MVQLQTTNELDDILSYISSLQIADIDSLQARASNHRGAVDDLNDEELAMLLFAQEAEGLLNITKDYASGSTSHRPLLEELAAREEMARYDHEVALAISEGRPIPPPPTPRNTRPFVVQIVYPGSDNERYALIRWRISSSSKLNGILEPSSESGASSSSSSSRNSGASHSLDSDPPPSSPDAIHDPAPVLDDEVGPDEEFVEPPVTM